MRTKTLLIAVAALAAGVISSQAQVYSANVVGYSKLSTPGDGTIAYALAVPFTVGVSNGANEVWPLVSGNPSIPDGSELSIWNGAGYNNYLSDSASATLWDDAISGLPVAAPKLPVGQGFFLIPSGNTTNVFAGAVAVNIGTSNKMTLPGDGTISYLVSPVVPYSGSITNGSNSGGGINLNGVPDGSELSTWNGSGYNNFLSDSASATLWDDAISGLPVPAPALSVGQSFFLIPSANYTWTVGL
jgi:hypothetical protein